jgi:transcriptional regulator with PAS, ATPase and Fis domain
LTIFEILNIFQKMAKILISWVATSNDFTDGKLPISSTSPNSLVHKEFWNYDKHILLSQAKNITDDHKILHLASHLRKTYKHIVEEIAMAIDDIIDVNEISGKVNSLLMGLQEDEIDIFISPGTPAMQVAWYLAHDTLLLNIKLFQLRKAEHTKAKIKTEQVWVIRSQSKVPTALLIRQELKGKHTDTKFLITKSVKPVYELAEKVAAADRVTVLILGETGTGKEGLAKFIHDKSPRAKAPFITLNCAAVGETLLESRLFGYAKGAHSMAHSDKAGLFEDANNGTIFLDEIGDISPYMQQSLLRVLQEKEISRIGESNVRKVNVRVIAATNRELTKLCSEGKFRWDLYYRLSVVDLTLPSLKERGVKETEELFDFIMEKKTADFKTSLSKIPAAVRKKIFNYPFPGNIRELENFIERLYATVEGDVTEQSIPKSFSLLAKEHSLKLEDIEREHIKKVYEMCGKVGTRAAKVLGISNGNLNSKIKSIYGS